MAIVGLQITNRGPYADGKTFGEVDRAFEVLRTLKRNLDGGTG